MDTTRGFISSFMKISIRSLHHKPRPGAYPKVHVSEVELNKPRIDYKRKRPLLLSQTVTDTLFPALEIQKKYIEEGKAVPRKFRGNGDILARKNFEKLQEHIDLDEPHFPIGKKQIYFTLARVCLLRPNAKHTPYQAKFLVPKSMNKMDLRDYLWHLYGLRALNVTVQLQPGRWTRGPHDLGRYRLPQVKKMTVDMLEPFVWPEISQKIIDNVEYEKKNRMKMMLHEHLIGSDKKKPLEVYDGIYEEKRLPNAFVPRKMRKQGLAKLSEYTKKTSAAADVALVNEFIGS